MQILPDLYLKTALEFALVGSRVTCDPPPVGTDQDVLILIKPGQLAQTWDALRGPGWSRGGSDVSFPPERGADDSPFASFKLGDWNLICTDDEVFYARFFAATSVAKRLNLLRKPDRIALFQAVLYANPGETLLPRPDRFGPT